MQAALKRWRYADYFLITILMALLFYGLAMVYSATFPSTNNSVLSFSPFVIKQIAFVVAGLGLMVLVASIDYRLLHASAYVLYVASLVLLAVVFVVGHGQSEWGSQRWIDLKLFPLQPSEMAKPALVLALARYFSDHQAEIRGFRHFVISFLITVPPVALVYMQPDLGTTASYLAIWFLMSLASGVRVGYLLVTVIGAL